MEYRIVKRFFEEERKLTSVYSIECRPNENDRWSSTIGRSYDHIFSLPTFNDLEDAKLYIDRRRSGSLDEVIDY